MNYHRFITNIKFSKLKKTIKEKRESLCYVQGFRFDWSFCFVYARFLNPLNFDGSASVGIVCRIFVDLMLFSEIYFVDLQLWFYTLKSAVWELTFIVSYQNFERMVE